jgi:serine/threonine protein phosphatase 1
MRLIAIGDIHGHLTKLERLMAKIEPRLDDHIIFLGDYIDRGPDSYEVVEFILEFRERFPATVTLCGNHEHFVTTLFLGNQSESLRNTWLGRNGGRATLTSYQDRGLLKVHQEFFSGLPYFHSEGGYFFCHAGVEPRVPLDRQKSFVLLEDGVAFHSYKGDHGMVVVHGHKRLESGVPEIHANRINLDTGAGHGGPLTAMELHTKRVWQAS